MLLLFGGLVSLWVFHDEAGPSGLLVPSNVFCPKGIKKNSNFGGRMMEEPLWCGSKYDPILR